MATADETTETTEQTAETAANAVLDGGSQLGVRRYFTIPGRDPFDEVEWETRDAFIPGKEKPAFDQKGVEFPKTWSQTATNIVAQKYFRGRMTLARPRAQREADDRPRRHDDRHVGPRAAATSRTRTRRQTFEDELKFILLHQLAAFNSPVWFNVGFEEKPQCSACFILSIDDSMESILDWIRREGVIFRGGSGSGVNLSKLRSSKEQLSKGGYASGPVSFMRGADASAGTIKSGGKTRRAAKMVVLDVDHPDVEEFIWCKAQGGGEGARPRGGRLRHVARLALTGRRSSTRTRTTRCASPTRSWRRPPTAREWNLTARTDGTVVDTVEARKLLRQIAEAAWKCADPGVQYDTTINKWHTLPNTSRINASNPCSEYMSIDDSACNLASLNLMKFRREDGELDVEAYEHAVDTVFLAQEILVGCSSYPTPEIEREREGVPAARARLREPRRAADGARAAVRLRRGTRVRGGGHVADDGPRVPQVLGDRGAHGPVRRLPQERRGDARRDVDAPRGRREHRERVVGSVRPAVGVPQGVGRRARPRRGARLPQRAVDGARADRDDQLHDGLRHDRRRAGLLARQVEEARRRRRDHDRQPHGAARAREARLRARRRWTRSSRGSTSATRSSARRT